MVSLLGSKKKSAGDCDLNEIASACTTAPDDDVESVSTKCEPIEAFPSLPFERECVWFPVAHHIQRTALPRVKISYRNLIQYLMCEVLRAEDYSSNYLWTLSESLKTMRHARGGLLLPVVHSDFVAKGLLRLSLLDKGYMLKQMSTKRDGQRYGKAIWLPQVQQKLMEFTMHTQTDRWPADYPDVDAQNQTKDGAIVVVDKGVIVSAACKLEHEPQIFTIDGGTRHQCGVAMCELMAGMAEWMITGAGGNCPAGGAVFTRSDSGCQTVAIPRLVGKYGAVFEIDDESPDVGDTPGNDKPPSPHDDDGGDSDSDDKPDDSPSPSKGKSTDHSCTLRQRIMEVCSFESPEFDADSITSLIQHSSIEDRNQLANEIEVGLKAKHFLHLGAEDDARREALQMLVTAHQHKAQRLREQIKDDGLPEHHSGQCSYGMQVPRYIGDVQANNIESIGQNTRTCEHPQPDGTNPDEHGPDTTTSLIQHSSLEELESSLEELDIRLIRLLEERERQIFRIEIHNEEDFQESQRQRDQHQKAHIVDQEMLLVNRTRTLLKVLKEQRRGRYELTLKTLGTGPKDMRRLQSIFHKTVYQVVVAKHLSQNCVP